MSIIEIISLLPLIIISVASITIMIAIAFKRSHSFTYLFSLLSFLVALLSLIPLINIVPVYISPLLIIDSYSLFYMGLIFAAGFIITMMSYSYWKLHETQKEEYYILLFIATLGSAILTTCNHFVSLFLGIELLSVSLYAMIAYLRHRDVSIEAGVKYLILAAVSSSFLLFGMALVYASLGKMGFYEIGTAINTAGKIPTVALAGFIMMLAGIGFKMAIVPFHMWTPDIYEGAPAPVSAFIASVSKGGVFAFLLRFFVEIEGYNYKPLVMIFSVLAVASMFTGNFLALMQTNVKRLLAYSSITHLGYLLIALIASEYSGVKAGTFYMVSYFITIIAAFGIVSIMSPCEKDADSIEDFKGLFWRRPWIAAMFSAALFSLAGIPLTIGFFGKFYLLTAGFESYLWVLIIMLVINSAISIYYYLRIVVAMFTQTDSEKISVYLPSLNPKVAFSSSLALAILFFFLIWLGIYPTGVMQMIDLMVKL